MKVTNTTWEFTLKKITFEKQLTDKVTKTVDGSYPDTEILDELQIDGWVLSVMTLMDTNYE